MQLTHKSLQQTSLTSGNNCNRPVWRVAFQSSKVCIPVQNPVFTMGWQALQKKVDMTMMNREPNQPTPNPQLRPLNTPNLQPNSSAPFIPNNFATPDNSKLPTSGRRTVQQLSGDNKLQQSGANPRDAQSPSRPHDSRIGSFGKVLLGFIGVSACLAAGFFLSPKPALTEDAHQNWKYVKLADDQSAVSGERQMCLLGSDRATRFITTAALGQKQNDSATTAAVKAAIQNGSTRDAVQAIAQAQKIPEVTLPLTGEKLTPQIMAPTLTEGFKEELLNGDVNFFHLFLFDCCAEDGDVVEVQINGGPFAIVPITHAGATLSIPLVIGHSTAVGLRGVRDGGGGITVAFATSEGDAFTGTLFVDDVVPLAIVGR